MDGFPQAPQAPLEYKIAQVCEAFGCLPTAALRELEEAPEGLVHTVMLVRAYAETKRQIDAAKSIDDQPTGPLADRCRAIDAEIMEQERARQARERGAQ